MLNVGWWIHSEFKIAHSKFRSPCGVCVSKRSFLTESERSGERLLKAARRVSESESIYRINRISGTRAGRDSGSAFLQENMGWDSQAVVKRSDHAEAEWAFVIKNF